MTTRAAFSDGRRAARIEAEVDASPMGLEIRDVRDGLLLALWAYSDLLPVERDEAARNPDKLRLTCRTDPAARLTITDAGQIATITRHTSALSPRKMRLSPLLVWSAALVGAVVGLALIYEALLWGARPLARMVPFSWEVAFGAGIAEQMEKGFGGACSTPAGQMALDTMVRRLTEAGGVQIPISVRVVKTPIVNAFALPGGQIIVFSGLIKEAESPDEVAGVLAHEISHVMLRHVMEQVIRHAGLGVVVILLTGDPSGASAGVLSALLGLSFSREAEAQADAMGLSLLQKADISTQGMANFFRRQEAKDRQQGRLPAFLSDHPSSVSRANIPTMQTFTRPALGTGEWLVLRSICE